jgi:hypothetical protein
MGIEPYCFMPFYFGLDYLKNNHLREHKELTGGGKFNFF